MYLKKMGFGFPNYASKDTLGGGVVKLFNPNLESEIFAFGLKKKFRYSWNFEFTHLFRPLKDVGGLDY